jgi:O-antigen ligase
LISNQTIATKQDYYFDKAQWVLAAGIVITMVWLPLLNAALCVLFFLFWLYKRGFQLKFIKPGYLLVFSALFLISAISFFYSENKQEAIATIQLKLPLLIFPIIFSTGVHWNTQQIDRLFLYFTYTVCAFSLLIAGNAIKLYLQTGNQTDLFGYHNIPFSYVYPSIASLFCVFTVAIHLNAISERKKVVLKNILPALICWGTLILLSNRMGLIICSLITLFFLLRMFQSKKTRMVIISMIVFSILLILIFNKPMRSRFETIMDFNTASMVPLDQDASLGRSWDGFYLRIAIWDCASDVIRQNFWLGVGSGDVQAELQKSYENRKFYFASRYNRYNAHNQFIEQWVMTGITGVLILAASILIPLYQNLKSGFALYSVFLFIFIFYCCSESMLEITKGVVWFSFFNSIFAFNHKNLNCL